MEDHTGRNALFRSTARHGVAQLLAVSICTAVLLLFAALTYSRITLPEYTSQYAQKDTQQVVNLIIAVVATVIGILLAHCRRITNEAETKSELRNDELTIPRLHVHVEAAGGAHAAMGIPALHNRDVWKLVAFYMFAITIFGFLSSVLSVIFVIDSIILQEGFDSPAYIPVGVEIPWEWDGQVVDPCSKYLSEPGCSYSLAMTSLTSAMVTNKPYTVGEYKAGSIEPRLTTLPVASYSTHTTERWAFRTGPCSILRTRFGPANTMKKFDRIAYRCLTSPNVIHCTEEPFIQKLGRTNSSMVQYWPLDAIRADNTSHIIKTAEMYQVSIPSNATDVDNVKYRNSDQDKGTMTIKMYPYEPYTNMTFITAVDSTGGLQGGHFRNGYASVLYYLMYGVWPDYYLHNSAYDPMYFAARCEFQSIKYRPDWRSSWRKVVFTLSNGVSRANVTEERCPNPKGNWTSGFDDLYFDVEGAGDVLSSTDGYCKLFSLNHDHSAGTNIFQGLSRFDAIVNKILHLTSTAWSQSIHHYAMLNQTVHSQPIIMTTYPHRYVIRISWTPATYIGLVLSLLITFNAWALAARWAWAVLRFRVMNGDTWNLLRPVDLMAYSLAAYRDLIHDLNTKEHRRSAMRGKTRTVLKEKPVWEGTSSLIGLINTMSATASSPISQVSEKIGSQEEGSVVATAEPRRTSDANEATQTVSPVERDDRTIE